jgi:hypothetical protein
MDSTQARKLYYQHANALAYVAVRKPDGTNTIGSAFHIGEGVFVTARHIVAGNEITEIKISEPVGVSPAEFFNEILRIGVSEEYIRQYKKMIGSVIGACLLFKHYLQPLQIDAGPFYPDLEAVDLAIFKTKDINPAAGIVKPGMHWDDWIYRGFWHLSDAIVMGYPPISMVNEPTLIAARAEIHTYVIPRHSPSVHFILSTMPRGGFSGGVAIHEAGDALGVVTSSLVEGAHPEQLGYFAVLSVEPIIKTLERYNVLPNIQKDHHDTMRGLVKKK